MPKINFSFKGFVRGADITTVADKDGKLINVSLLSSVELADKLQSGEYTIVYTDHHCSPIEIHEGVRIHKTYAFDGHDYEPITEDHEIGGSD